MAEVDPPTAAEAVRHALPSTSQVRPTPDLPPLRPGETVLSLLQPTIDWNDPDHVHFGSLRVDTAIAADFAKAQIYLSRDPEAVRLLSALVHSPDTHTITAIDQDDPLGDGFIRHGGSDPAHPTPSGGEIRWDPHAAIRELGGGAMSPAVALLHEEGHAWEWMSDPQSYLAGSKDKNQRYDNAEEQRNGTGLERRASGLLGEGVRQDHGGDPYVVADPTSTKPIEPRVPSHRFEAESIRRSIRGLDAHGYAAPPLPDSQDSVTPWDHQPHSGTFVAVDAYTVAQHVGRRQYQLFDVERDLHGVYPDQTRSLDVDARGMTHDPSQVRQLEPHR